MRRFIALVLCIALCFGLFAMPSYALDATYIYTACGFWSFLNRSIFSGIYDVADALWGLGSDYYGGGRSTSYNGGGRPDADVQSAYNSYVTGLDTDLGTHVIGDNGFRIYATPSLFSDNYRTPNNPLRFTYSVYATHFTLTGYFRYCWIYLNPLVAPLDGIYTREISISRGVNHPSTEDLRNTVSGGDLAASTVLVSSDSYFYLAGSDQYYDLDIRLSYWVQPHNYNANTFVSGGSASRAPSILTSIMQVNTTNNAFYIGTKDASGAITNVYTTNIFNEETKVFTVPGETPVEHTVTNWNYDYSTRTYNCSDGTNNYVVTYGDDYITVTVPDGSGGTTSTNYYYVHQTPVPTPAVPGSDTSFPGASSDNFEDDPNTTGGFFSTVWKAFKDGLASLIAGIIKGLFKGIKALIDGITSVFSGLVSGFFGFVTSFFDSFGTGPGAVGQFFGGGVVDLG